MLNKKQFFLLLLYIREGDEKLFPFITRILYICYYCWNFSMKNISLDEGHAEETKKLKKL